MDRPIWVFSLCKTLTSSNDVCLFSLVLPDNYDPEGYNPESPGMTAAGRPQYRQFIPCIQTQRPNLIGLTSGDGQGSRGITCGSYFGGLVWVFFLILTYSKHEDFCI